jgi:putative membrane protein insertion efficiency factor
MRTPLTDAIEGSQPLPAPLAVRIVLGLLRGYKILISPLFTGACRFQPSCADYMAEAVTLHGARRGIWLGFRRLARCRPFAGHGYDPVPRP